MLVLKPSCVRLNVMFHCLILLFGDEVSRRTEDCELDMVALSEMYSDILEATFYTDIGCVNAVSFYEKQVHTIWEVINQFHWMSKNRFLVASSHFVDNTEHIFIQRTPYSTMVEITLVSSRLDWFYKTIHIISRTKHESLVTNFRANVSSLAHSTDDNDNFVKHVQHKKFLWCNGSLSLKSKHTYESNFCFKTSLLFS